MCPVMPPGLQYVEPSLNVDKEQEVEGEDREEDAAEVVMVVDVTDAEALEPKSLAEAKRRPDWVEWERGIHEELKTLEEVGTWRLENPPADANIVGSKWIF